MADSIDIHIAKKKKKKIRVSTEKSKCDITRVSIFPEGTEPPTITLDINPLKSFKTTMNSNGEGGLP